MNSLKNNTKGTLRQHARRKSDCEPTSFKLYSQLFRLFPILSVTDGDTTRTFTCHADGQLASANYGDSSESFVWDGLALIQRGDEQFINEPHVGGGNPVASSQGTSYFNDALGTTVGAKKDGKYSAAVLTAFGEGTDADKAFFTGKPMVEGLGHAFLMRNYRAGLAKWQTADPMGYPDGWNALAYCENGVTSEVDLWGCVSLNLFKANDFCHVIADKYEEAGFFTVGAHGPIIEDAQGVKFTAASLAETIRASGWNGTDPIKLLSCCTGRYAKDFCQDLANILGVSVYAADTLVWYFVVERTWRWWFCAWFGDADYDHDPSTIVSVDVKPYYAVDNDKAEMDKSRPGNFVEFKPE